LFFLTIAVTAPFLAWAAGGEYCCRVQCGSNSCEARCADGCDCECYCN